MVGQTVLAISLLRRDGGTQPRGTISPAIVEAYANDIADGAVLPPVTIFYDGTDYWLADGFHRVAAHETLHDIGILKEPQIAVDIRQGTRRDAVLFSAGANASHGYRRSNADKRRAVETLLNDPEWAKWSNREIARLCNVSAPLVAELRPTPTVNSYSSVERVFQKEGSEPSVMRVAAIGGRPSEKAPIGAVSDARAAEMLNVSDCEPLPEPIFDHEASYLMLAIADTIELIESWPPVSEALAKWAQGIGGAPSHDAIRRAARWLSDFEAHWPAAAAQRERRIQSVLQGA